MEGGPAHFRNDVPFRMVIQGAINGKAFSVEGKGAGNSAMGTMKGKWECVSGKLPLAWPALAGTLGFKYDLFHDLFCVCFMGGSLYQYILSNMDEY